MRNIIGLLYRYNAVFVFIVLQALAIALIVSFNPYHRTSYFNSSNAIAGSLKDFTHSLREPFIAKDENEKLRKENAQLHNLDPKNYFPNEQQEVSVSDSVYAQQYTYVSAQVLDFSYTKHRNSLLLSAGSKNGLEAEMGVVGPDGLVGFVKNVSAHYAHVIPIINPDFSTGVVVKKTNYPGILSWQGGDHRTAKIEELSKTSPIEVGDTIITRGGKGRFPKGIPVGIIKSFDIVPGQNDYNIDIILFTNFANIRYGYIITNRLQGEMDLMQSHMEREANND